MYIKKHMAISNNSSKGYIYIQFFKKLGETTPHYNVIIKVHNIKWGKKNLLSSHPIPLKSFRIYNNSAAVIYIFQNKNKTKTNSIPCICIDMFFFFSVADYTHLHNIYLNKKAALDS